MNMEAILYKHGTGDYELWQLDLPTEVMKVIETILDQYRDTGCSVRGTANDIKEELRGYQRTYLQRNEGGLKVLEKIKRFAEENFAKDELDQIYADDVEYAVTNPWMDHTGRFELTDEEAVKEWGLDIVVEFCIKAWEVIG